MRGKILDALFESMKVDENIFFLTADMGIGLIERFKEKFPNRFLNVGIAEQNLIGIAAGLVNLGYKPFVYTISNFAIHRCFEQIRNEIGLHKYKITILGTSCGYDNAPLGPTHHVIDDWSALSNIPNIDIFCPSSVSYAASPLLALFIPCAVSLVSSVIGSDGKGIDEETVEDSSSTSSVLRSSEVSKESRILWAVNGRLKA